MMREMNDMDVDPRRYKLKHLTNAGWLPINNFQVIMSDYELPLLSEDLRELEKKGFIRGDELDQEYVDYQGVLAQVRPRANASVCAHAVVQRAVLRLQTAWRGYKARQVVAARRKRHQAEVEALGEMTHALKTYDKAGLARATGKGAATKAGKGTKGEKGAATKGAKGKQG